MTKTNLCEMCRRGEIEFKDIYKPLHATSKQIVKVKKMTIYCNSSSRYIQKMMLKCEQYRPKAGKIGKKLYQKQLGET